MTELPIIAGSLTPNYCFVSWQTLLNDFMAVSYVELDVTGARYVISQTTAPSASQRDFVWHNPNTGHVLTWNSGVTSWTMPHGSAASGYERRIWVGDLTQLETFDGGAAGVVSATGGPVWERDTTFNDRGLLGVGTTAATPLATGGSATVTVAQANLPAVTLSVDTAIIGQSSVGSPEAVVGNTYGSTAISGAGLAVDSTSSSLSARYYTKGQTEAMGSGTALTVTNPYVGVYLIKRTARIYYTS